MQDRRVAQRGRRGEGDNQEEKPSLLAKRSKAQENWKRKKKSVKQRGRRKDTMANPNSLELEKGPKDKSGGGARNTRGKQKAGIKSSLSWPRRLPEVFEGRQDDDKCRRKGGNQRCWGKEEYCSTSESTAGSGTSSSGNLALYGGGGTQFAGRLLLPRGRRTC